MSRTCHLITGKHFAHISLIWVIIVPEVVLKVCFGSGSLFNGQRICNLRYLSTYLFYLQRMNPDHFYPDNNHALRWSEFLVCHYFSIKGHYHSEH